MMWVCLLGLSEKETSLRAGRIREVSVEMAGPSASLVVIGGLEKRAEEKTSRLYSKNGFAGCGELQGEQSARTQDVRHTLLVSQNHTAWKLGDQILRGPLS